ncbi:MAG: GNAT family N-acetyltransferase [Granulosicoccaceae bacterium]
MIVRCFEPSDAAALWSVFFHTIRQVNVRDYSQAQVEAWAAEGVKPEYWAEKMRSMNPYVACVDQRIVGYADLQPDGLIDHFFCHHAFQGCGVGRALMERILLEAQGRSLERCYSHVSITARPFFAHFGFALVREQRVDIGEQKLTNFLMEKRF